MRFTKQISREVDIDDTPYVVSVDETGISFRVKGKRKSTQVAWSSVLAIATEQPAQSSARGQGESSGSRSGSDSSEQTVEEQYDTQPLEETAFSRPDDDANENEDDSGFSRTATAGERNQDV